MSRELPEYRRYFSLLTSNLPIPGTLAIRTNVQMIHHSDYWFVDLKTRRNNQQSLYLLEDIYNALLLLLTNSTNSLEYYKHIWRVLFVLCIWLAWSNIFKRREEKAALAMVFGGSSSWRMACYCRWITTWR